MKKLILLFSFIFFNFFTSFPGYSQFSASEARKNYKNSKASERGLDRYKRYTSIGGSVNAFNYYGDLAPWEGKLSTDVAYTRPGLGLVAMRRISPLLSLRGTFTHGRVRADDFSADYLDEAAKYRYRRNLHFRNTINELSFTGVLDFIKNRNDYFDRPWFIPYVFLGIAIFHHNPKAQVPVNQQVDRAEWIPLQPLRTEGKAYSRIQIATPIGIGARIKLNQRLDLALEFGLRQLYMDYLDDVSTVYVDPGTLDSDLARTMAGRAREPIAAAVRQVRDVDSFNYANDNLISFESVDGTTYSISRVNTPGGRRGNPNDNDIYIVTSIQLTYIILPKIYRAKYRE